MSIEMKLLPLANLTRTIATDPTRLLAAFTFIHVVFWTIVPTILCDNPPLDIIEGVAYGQEWQLSYWKLPPLPWWIDQAVWQLAGARIWPFFLVGQGAVAICFWA